MKLLLVGIDQNTKSLLEQSGMLVEIAEADEVEDLVDYLETIHYDACVINLDERGWGAYVCRTVRSKKIEIPLVGVSSGGVTRWGEYRALFLENGGDDLIRLPLNQRELVASISAIIRRTSRLASDILSINYHGKVLKINIPAFAVSLDGTLMHLTPQEYKILVALVRALGRTLSKENLMDALYVDGIDDMPEVKTIDVFVCKLRKKLNLAQDGLGQIIETVWGKGYQFVTPLAQNAA